MFWSMVLIMHEYNLKIGKNIIIHQIFVDAHREYALQYNDTGITLNQSLKPKMFVNVWWRSTYHLHLHQFFQTFFLEVLGA